ncbi:MAG: hypothetical protein EBZ69_01890 [Alphaproteobacteria bacterium]|nr:hypothetical protein [Alphaproteobacteria bacterium]
MLLNHLYNKLVMDYLMLLDLLKNKYMYYFDIVTGNLLKQIVMLDFDIQIGILLLLIVYY